MLSQVGDVDQLFGGGHARHRARTDHRFAPPKVGKGRWSIMHCDDARKASPSQSDSYAEMCLTEACGILQHGLEHRLQIARR